MIHSLTLKNTIKHNGQTFYFSSGLNIIRGENEAGKSLILEYIDFALHGSKALRLPVGEYPHNMMVELVTTISGEGYKIIRTPKSAELSNNNTGEVIAVKSKTVDAEIRKLLGYSRNVFMVSNYSSQDAINYLSTLKPAERKKTIDNVIGLTAVEQVIADHKANLTLLNKLLASEKTREPTLVEKPDSVEIENEKVHDLIKYSREKIASLNTQIAVQETTKIQQENVLKQKPELLPEPDLSGLLEVSEQELAIQNNRISFLAQQLQQVLEVKLRKLKTQEPVILPEPSLDQFIQIDGDCLTEDFVRTRSNQVELQHDLWVQTQEELNKNPKPTGGLYTEDQLKANQEQEDLFKDYLNVQKLKEAGTVECSKCGTEILISQDAIDEHFSHVPNEEVTPVIYTTAALRNFNDEYRDHLEKHNNLMQKLEHLEKNMRSLNAKLFTPESVSNHLKACKQRVDYVNSAFEHQTWLSKIAELEDQVQENQKEYDNLLANAFAPEAVAKHRECLQLKNAYEQNVRDIQQWRKTYNSLIPYLGDHYLEGLKKQLTIEGFELNDLQKNLSEWLSYNTKKDAYEIWLVAKDNAQKEVDLEKQKLATLDTYKAKIKTSILPSVNNVATQWLQRMSLGKHESVCLTDTMAILVNGKPIEALSVSGRALAHLSLRMALGQVLTNHVYPVFMADEVDASMRDERGQQVLDALCDTLSGSMKQIIMISHRALELDRIANLIEV